MAQTNQFYQVYLYNNKDFHYQDNSAICPDKYFELIEADII